MSATSFGRGNSRLNRRIERYIRRRTPEQPLPLRISRRRLYIMPTASGSLFAVLLIVMVLGATNYNNNLAFVLTFWLGAVALVSMHRTHRNLADLEMTAVDAEPVFAGQTIRHIVTLASGARTPRFSLLLSRLSDGSKDLDDGDIANNNRRLTITAGGHKTSTITIVAGQRGYQPCPMLRIESRYPMGLFRAWTQCAPAAPVLVYPHPAGDIAYPSTASARSGRDTQPVAGGDEFIAHRRYQSGDSPRRIDWKASARSTQLLVTEHADVRQPTHWFDYAALTGMTIEARLSQLTLWVVNAAAAGDRYGLQLPEQALGPAQGATHRLACLRALALYS